jgi:hypothetical protein
MRAPSHDCPGMRIHVIDIVQSPGMGMPSMADISRDCITVTTTLATNSAAETPRNTARDARAGRP